MSIYFIAQRKRDIAVRKVFGSDSRSEMLRLMKFSSASLAVSLIIGLPLMYIGIQQIDKIVTYESSFLVGTGCRFPDCSPHLTGLRLANQPKSRTGKSSTESENRIVFINSET